MKRTDAYVMTIDPNCHSDLELLEAVRNSIKYTNSIQRKANRFALRNSEKVKQFRVSLKGRLGKNNPNAYKYKNQTGAQTIRLEDAQRIDVYIHERR